MVMLAEDLLALPVKKPDRREDFQNNRPTSRRPGDRSGGSLPASYRHLVSVALYPMRSFYRPKLLPLSYVPKFRRGAVYLRHTILLCHLIVFLHICMFVPDANKPILTKNDRLVCNIRCLFVLVSRDIFSFGFCAPSNEYCMSLFIEGRGTYG